MPTPVLAAMLAFGAALVIVRALAGERLGALVLDQPNARSLHDRPIPRTGGVGLMLGAVLAWLAAGAAALPGVVALGAALATLFLVDDVRGLPVSTRLGAQVAAAVAFVWLTGPYPPLLLPCLVAGLVWSANLYNFMDGANGMAGGMALVGFAAYAVAAHAAGAGDLALVAAVLAGAAAGFLVWNFDPARIFLGDAGSIPLGFLAGALGVVGWQRGTWPFWLPVLVFSPFVVDSGLTLAQRWQRGERLSQAHKSHYYQRLVRMGWSHRRLALSAYALMLAAACAALALSRAHPLVVVLALASWVAIYGALATLVDRRWRGR